MRDYQLNNKLREYAASDYYPFHMPGHKRNFEHLQQPYQLDITEISGFDNLHHPEGILAEGMRRTAEFYGCDRSFYLVNGSTAGILAAIGATVMPGDRVLAARNSHKAVYHGFILGDLETEFIYPHYNDEFQINGGLNPENIRRLLISHPKIKMVFLTSPTYEGVVSDIGKIAEYVHERQIPLIVDEAHGAHFQYHDFFPDSALRAGADIVIQSLHKTLPSLTQTAVMHVRSGLVDIDRISQYLGIYQTSSPSYVLMSSIEQCLSYMRIDGREKMKIYLERLQNFRKIEKRIKNIRLLGSHSIGKYDIFDLDLSKLFFSGLGTNLTGPMLQERLLKDYHLEMEMSQGSGVLGITSLCDTEEGFRRLETAILELDDALKHTDEQPKQYPIPRLTAGMTIGRAWRQRKKTVLFAESGGRISGEFIYAYPPGIPVAAPGEVITDKLITYVESCRSAGISFQGMRDFTGKYIDIIDK